MAATGSDFTDEKVSLDNTVPDSKNSSSLSVNNASAGSDSPVVENDSFLFFSYLDEIEDRIENLRRHAIALSQEKSSLLLVLSQLKEESMTAALKKDEFQEICVNMERLRTRCKAVDIKVETIRSPEQLEAFVKVSSLVDELEDSISKTDDKPGVIKRTKTYLNACSSDGAENGAIDFKFQGMILDCVIEDQKLIRHRLENIVMNYCRSMNRCDRPMLTYTDSDNDRGQSDNCIKPSDISSAVKNSPNFGEYCEPKPSVTHASTTVNANSVENATNSNACAGNENENVASINNS